MHAEPSHETRCAAHSVPGGGPVRQSPEVCSPSHFFAHYVSFRTVNRAATAHSKAAADLERLDASANANLQGLAMLLQDLPPKTAHQILRSVTWTDVEMPRRATAAIRGSIRRAARWASGWSARTRSTRKDSLCPSRGRPRLLIPKPALLPRWITVSDHRGPFLGPTLKGDEDGRDES
jgi:hypothetical protein